MHWVRRNILHLPRGMGGLGIRRLSTMNTTFLMKQVWRMHQNPQLLLSQVYVVKGKFALTTGLPNICRCRVSWGMRGLRRAETMLLQGCAWKIGNGRNVSAGKNNWVLGKVPVFASHILLSDAKSWKVSHFIQDHHLIEDHGLQWNASLVRSSFENMDANAILSVELPSSPAPDRLYWTGHKTRNFTIKTGYAFLQHDDIHYPSFSGIDQNRFIPFFKLLWALKILPKWKLFIWKLLREGIPVKANLERRGIVLDTTCNFCSERCEDAQYIFRFCNFGSRCVESSMLGIFSNFNEDLSLQEWILNYIQLFISLDGKFSDRVITFIATLWALWVTRNTRVFRSEPGHIQTVYVHLRLAMEQSTTFIGKDKGNLDFLHPPEYASTYPSGFFFAHIGVEILPMPSTIMQIDGAWNKVTSRAGMGWILQKPVTSGNEICGGCDYGLGHSTLHVEAMACPRALQWAKDSSLDVIVLYTDSATLVSYLQRQVVLDIHLTWTVTTILDIGKSFRCCMVNKVHRDQFQQAHDLAKRAAKDGLHFVSTFGVRPDG
ncbi:uncharacterized protein [Spinacia oleracea]|uniref:RNase H type-1 domain-containing protein n=1 Tax=Spinacia oleracea TaxID=3562 RepID=A0ABM3R8Q5_SPIOL|nr:uncharacterized protein LOC130467499 [Spinacia oleracea]